MKPLIFAMRGGNHGVKDFSFTPKSLSFWPERWRTSLDQAEALRKLGGRPNACWRANRCNELSEGAKDLSSDLVAGCVWSFSHDSWDTFYWGTSGKAMIGVIGDEMSSSDSQTLNGRGKEVALFEPSFKKSQSVLCGLAGVSLAGEEGWTLNTS